MAIDPLRSSLRLDNQDMLKISSRPRIFLDCKQCMAFRFLPKTFLVGTRHNRSVLRPGFWCQCHLDI